MVLSTDSYDTKEWDLGMRILDQDQLEARLEAITLSC